MQIITYISKGLKEPQAKKKKKEEKYYKATSIKLLKTNDEKKTLKGVTEKKMYHILRNRDNSRILVKNNASQQTTDNVFQLLKGENKIKKTTGQPRFLHLEKLPFKNECNKESFSEISFNVVRSFYSISLNNS